MPRSEDITSDMKKQVVDHDMKDNTLKNAVKNSPFYHYLTDDNRDWLKDGADSDETIEIEAEGLKK